MAFLLRWAVNRERIAIVPPRPVRTDSAAIHITGGAELLDKIQTDARRARQG